MKKISKKTKVIYKIKGMMSCMNEKEQSGGRKTKPRFLTVKQFCEYLGDNVVTPYTIYDLIKKKEIPAITIGNKILIPMVWVEEYFNVENLLRK